MRSDKPEVFDLYQIFLGKFPCLLWAQMVHSSATPDTLICHRFHLLIFQGDIIFKALGYAVAICAVSVTHYIIPNTMADN
jgi:hypothetical protein